MSTEQRQLARILAAARDAGLKVEVFENPRYKRATPDDSRRAGAEPAPVTPQPAYESIDFDGGVAILFRIPKRATLYQHEHTTDFEGYCASGTVLVGMRLGDDFHYALHKAGDRVVIPAGVKHTIAALDDAVWYSIFTDVYEIVN